jgi:GDPmannose 4,6-dehydratase
MKKTALITGILGQDGSYLSKLLLENNYEVFGLLRRKSIQNFENTDFLNTTNNINFLTGDITDGDSLTNIIKKIKPDEIYNLAAQSFVGASWALPKNTTDVNSLGVLHLLESIKNNSPKSKLYQASTSEMFGNSNVNGIQDENTPFHPRSPYGISKLYSYWLTNNYKESYNLYCTNGILFNHESPIRGLEFVTRKITHGVAKIKLGLGSEIRLGNIDTYRDWGFAGDYVEAMYLTLQQKNPDNYVICTGESHSIREFLDIAFNEVGIRDWTNYVVIDEKFYRPAEIFTLKGNSTKSKEILGWKPKVNFEDLVKMMVKEDLKRVSINNKIL